MQQKRQNESSDAKELGKNIVKTGEGFSINPLSKEELEKLDGGKSLALCTEDAPYSVFELRNANGG